MVRVELRHLVQRRGDRSCAARSSGRRSSSEPAGPASKARARRPPGIGSWSCTRRCCFTGRDGSACKIPTAADLVQDVFLILWRKLPEFKYDSAPELPRLAENDLPESPPLPATAAQPPSRRRWTGRTWPTSPTAELADAEDTRYLIRQAFRLIEREFSPLHQKAFRAYVLEERPPEEVARDLGHQPGDGLRHQVEDSQPVTTGAAAAARLSRGFRPFSGRTSPRRRTPFVTPSIDPSANWGEAAMDRKLECPPPSVLADLIQGKLVEPELSELSVHLETARPARRRPGRSPRHDTLIESLRGEAPARTGSRKDVPRPLVERLKQIPRARGVTGRRPPPSCSRPDVAPEARGSTSWRRPSRRTRSAGWGTIAS